MLKTNTTKIIPINNKIYKIIINIKRKECSVCLGTKSDIFGNIYLQDYRCSNKCNINKNGEKTWFICYPCHEKWREDHDNCLICRGVEDKSEEIIKHYNKCEKLVSFCFNISSKCKNIILNFSYNLCNLYKKIIEINICELFSIFISIMMLSIILFVIWTTLYMFCNKMKDEICIPCSIISFIGLIHTILFFILGLIINNVIINELEKYKIFYARFYCIISLSLILTFIGMMDNCKLEFEYFYYFVFNLIGMSFANCLLSC